MTKFFGCATGVACALVLSSCGSDSSNGPGSDVSKTKISIDELNRTITSYENESYDFCVYDSVGNRFDWKRNMVTELDTFEIHYLFKGDTLVLFEEGGRRDRPCRRQGEFAIRNMERSEILQL